MNTMNSAWKTKKAAHNRRKMLGITPPGMVDMGDQPPMNQSQGDSARHVGAIAETSATAVMASGSKLRASMR